MGDQVADQKEGRVALHPSAVQGVHLAVQGVHLAVQEVPQVAREGLRGDRAVKPEGPVAMRRESHWAEAQEVRRMHPEEERTQAGLER